MNSVHQASDTGEYAVAIARAPDRRWHLEDDPPVGCGDAPPGRDGGHR